MIYHLALLLFSIVLHSTSADNVATTGNATIDSFSLINHDYPQYHHSKIANVHDSSNSVVSCGPAPNVHHSKIEVIVTKTTNDHKSASQHHDDYDHHVLRKADPNYLYTYMYNNTMAALNTPVPKKKPLDAVSKSEKQKFGNTSSSDLKMQGSDRWDDFGVDSNDNFYYHDKDSTITNIFHISQENNEVAYTDHGLRKTSALMINNQSDDVYEDILEPLVMASKFDSGIIPNVRNEDPLNNFDNLAFDNYGKNNINIYLNSKGKNKKIIPSNENGSMASMHINSSSVSLNANSLKSHIHQHSKLFHDVQDAKPNWNKRKQELYNEGSTVRYICKPGYRLVAMDSVGNKRDNSLNEDSKNKVHIPHLVCKNGWWQGSQPKCVRHCLKPPHIRNGYHLQLNSEDELTEGIDFVDVRVQVLCHVGFVLHGPDVFQCSGDGSWTPRRRARCTPSKDMLSSTLCPPPSSPPHSRSVLVRGEVSLAGALHGTVLRHRCLPGYRHAGPQACNTTRTTRCEAGRWTGAVPSCEPFSHCLPPPSVHHSVRYEVSSEYPLQYRLYYYCQEGYRLTGSSVIRCHTDTGCWEPVHNSPLCEPISPGVLPSDGVGLNVLDIHTLLVVGAASVLALLLVVVAALLYHRTLRPKRMRRLHNSASNTGADLTASGGEGPENCGDGGASLQHHHRSMEQQQQQQQHLAQQQQQHAALLAAAQQRNSVPVSPSSVHLPHNNTRLLIKHYADQGVPPSYEESVRQHRPLLLDHPHPGYGHAPSGGRSGSHRTTGVRGNSAGAGSGGGGSGGGHRVVGVAGGVRRTRHRDHPDNISYQSVGSARHSAASMRSWSACGSLGSTDTVHAPTTGGNTGDGGCSSIASESTNVTLDTLSTLSSVAASQGASCRALFGSRTSFDSSSLITNEGAPLLEEAECEEGCIGAVDRQDEGQPAPDQLSQDATRELDDPVNSNSSGSSRAHVRSPVFSLCE